MHSWYYFHTYVDGSLILNAPMMFNESSGVHQICVNVVTEGQIELFDFDIFLEARNGSAGIKI